ncbi:MAG TPA: TolC family protein [Chitinophagaceae bacterium]|nr:TolC family protein [Chitinophagaceae bacterium]
MRRKLIILLFFFLFVEFTQAQEKLSLDTIFSAIKNNHPNLKSFDAQIRSLDEAAKGARNWEPPELGTGLWMTPYNPNLRKRQSNGNTGMGQYMISAQQMFPNGKRLDAEQHYMQAMSSVEKERKNTSLNELYATAKQNYFQLIIIAKKLAVLDQDEKLLDFMIKNAELRYKNNMGKISSYYKAKASLGNIQSMRVMLENEMVQKRISLNTLMNRDKTITFDIDTTYTIKDYSNYQFDSTTFNIARSDIKAVDRDIQLTLLQQQVEQAKLKPEFGLRFDHMFGFGGLPMQYSVMGMVKLPMAKWSSRAAKANVESLKWKTESLNQQKQTIINEASGMTQGMRSEIEAKKKQIRLFEENIIPALRKNFQTMQLGYENNTEELFELYDAWETLNMTQLEYLDQLQQLLLMQVELERILEIK